MNKKKLNIICYYPDTPEDMKAVSYQTSQIHAETVINHISKLDISDNDKIRVMSKIG